MLRKRKMRAVHCMPRGRDVYVTYTVVGGPWGPEYDVVSCPAMYDPGVGCDRRCRAQIGLNVQAGLFGYGASG